MRKLNLANSIYKGFNDIEGLMICGYEWGESKADGDFDKLQYLPECTFSNKVPRYGFLADSWPYDRKIRAWFDAWGAKLNRDGDGCDFDKTIIQTNWALGSRPEYLNIRFYLEPENVDNFIYHVETLKPSLIMFMGNQLLTKCLRHHSVHNRFKDIFGEEIGALEALRMDGYCGPMAYLQSYEYCVVLGLPHPTGSLGVTSEYVNYLSEHIAPIISRFKKNKGIE